MIPSHLIADAGPIVRITPDELHIQDSTFWEELYVRHPKQWKYEWTAGRFGTNNSVFTTSDPALHRVRRSALNSMYVFWSDKAAMLSSNSLV